jgi:hypothetical protein
MPFAGFRAVFKLIKMPLFRYSLAKMAMFSGINAILFQI